MLVPWHVRADMRYNVYSAEVCGTLLGIVALVWIFCPTENAPIYKAISEKYSQRFNKDSTPEWTAEGGGDLNISMLLPLKLVRSTAGTGRKESMNKT